MELRSSTPGPIFSTVSASAETCSCVWVERARVRSTTSCTARTWRWISSIDEVSSWAAEATVCTFSAVDSAAAFTCWVPPAESLAFFRSEEHTSELQSLMRISYAVFCLKKKTKIQKLVITPSWLKHQEQ